MQITDGDASIRFAARRQLRGEISLPKKILRREGFDRPRDACGILCLDAMEEKLKALGAQKGEWTETAG